jgi:hypothetical protein
MLAFPCRDRVVARSCGPRTLCAAPEVGSQVSGGICPTDLPSVCRLPASQCKSSCDACRRRRSEPDVRSPGILPPTASPGATGQYEPRGANLVRRPSQASQLRTSGILLLSAGFSATGWCEPRARRQVRTRRSPKPKELCGLRRIGCEPQCDGCDG